VLILGDCDTGVRKLAAALGWLEELEALWAQTQPAKSTEETAAEAKAEAQPKSKDEQLSEEVARLTAEVDQTLKVTNTYETKVRNQLKINGDHEKTTEPSTQPSAGSEGDGGNRASSLESPESMERKDEILRPNED
jgi:NAD-dependent histone deacetylase SIR2